MGFTLAGNRELLHAGCLKLAASALSCTPSASVPAYRRSVSTRPAAAWVWLRAVGAFVRWKMTPLNHRSRWKVPVLLLCRKHVTLWAEREEQDELSTCFCLFFSGFFSSGDSIICVEVYWMPHCSCFFCLFSNQMDSTWTTIAALHFETLSDQHPSHVLSVFISSICFFFQLSQLPTYFNAVNTEMGHVGSVCVYCTVCKWSSLQSHAFRWSSTKKKKRKSQDYF